MPSKKPVLTEAMLQKYIAFEKLAREPMTTLAERGLDELVALQEPGEHASSPKVDALMQRLVAQAEVQRREAATAADIELAECDWIRSLAQGVLRARRDPAYPAAHAIPRSMRAPTLAELAGTYGSKNVDLVLAHEAMLAELGPCT